MPIKLVRHHLNSWLAAGQHVHTAEGAFYQMTGLYPTLDRQEIRRAPAVSSHLTHPGLDTVEGMFWDAANERFVLIGQDSSDDLACTYFSSAWSHVGSSYTLDTAVSVMDGYMMRNFIYAHGYLWVLCDTQTQRTSDYTSSALSSFDTNDVLLIAHVGGRIYCAKDNGRTYRLTSDGLTLENHYDPAADITFLWMGGLKDDLLIVASMLDGQLHVMRYEAYAKTSIRKLEDMATLPGDPGNYPDAGCPFCIHDNDLYLLSGDMPNPDGTVTRDILVYTGYRIERVARIDDGSASATSLGLLSWRGELIYYEFTTSTAKFKMLVGSGLIDFFTPSSYSGTAINSLAASLAGHILFTGKSGSDEGIYHLGAGTLQDGNVETAWLDGGLPGVKKRLIALSLHVKNAASTTVKTLSYKADDAGSYTQAATETDATEQLAVSSLGVEFYRLRIKAAIADTTATTTDIRITGISYTYALGDE